MRPLTGASLAALLLSASSVFVACGEGAKAEASSGALEVGEEVVLMAPGGAGGTRRGKPSVVFGRDNYLVVWLAFKATPPPDWHRD